MIHIKVEFHTHQYQACAWGNHHSEGVIDWPPAPWRILRAIVAGSYAVNLQPKYLEALKGVLHKLAADLPSYTLPPVTYIQHRSPRPQVNLKTAKVGPGKTLYSAGLLMSADQRVLYIQWPIEITEVEELVLNLCLAGLTYFGRKESVATVSLAEEAPDPNSSPDAQGNRIVAIPDQTLDQEDLWQALNLSAHENYGINRTAIFPGVRQATYRVETRQPQIRQEVWPVQHTVTLSVMASPRLPFHLGLKLTHRLHQRLISHCSIPVFTGQELGEPSKTHDHTIFQCIPDQSGRYVEQVRLYSHSGYGPEALTVISQCYTLPGVARGYTVSLSMSDLGAEPEKSDRWRSHTPFYLSRFPAVRRGKPRMVTEHYQKDGPEYQVLKFIQFLPWLNLQGEPTYQEHEEGLAIYFEGEIAAVASCEPFPKFWEWESECRQGKKVGRIGYNVQLWFSQPVSGPIVLGYAAHYGLGSLVPVRGWGECERPIRQDPVVASLSEN